MKRGKPFPRKAGPDEPVRFLQERIFPNVVVNPFTGCWLWQGTLAKGYGRITVSWLSLTPLSVHRAVYQIYKGFIPEGMQVCHSCDTPACCNPAHLWLGTPKDNTGDMLTKGRGNRKRKTHCKRGHEFTPENTKIRPNGSKYCVTCGRDRASTSYVRKKEKNE